MKTHREKILSLKLLFTAPSILISLCNKMSRNLCLVILLFNAWIVKANAFEEYINSGKWAHAKHWLITQKQNLPETEYFIKHIRLSSFLNELEIGKAYADSLKQCKLYNQDDLAKAHYNWFYARYYQYKQLFPLSFSYATQSIEYAEKANDKITLAFANAQMANTLRGYELIDKKLYTQRLDFAKKSIDVASQFGDEYLFYHAKIIQLSGLIWFEKSGKKILSPHETVKQIRKSTELISSRFPYHPQVVHNLSICAMAWLEANPDSALSYCEKAETILMQINDFSHGILMNLASGVFYQMEAAYEAKYEKTQNIDYLNRSIVWAKHNLGLLKNRLHYLGFYFYRRYDDRSKAPIEQRISNLYYKLYLKTKNTNYLNFTFKYAEYMHHHPIQQVGLTIPIYETLPQMVQIEKGEFHAEKNDIFKTSNLITHPKYIAQILSPNQAFISYFAYQNNSTDSVDLLVQYITKQSYDFITLTYHKVFLKDLPETMLQSVMDSDEDTYFTSARKGFTVLLQPILVRLPASINKLIIIPPSIFKSPVLFDGLIVDDNGKDFSSFNYLINHYNISYEQSFTHFVANNNGKINVEKINVWNPDYEKTNLAELSEANQIAANIKSFFSVEELKFDNKKQFTHAILTYPILQITAHANGTFKSVERARIYTGLTNKDSVFYDIDLEKLSGNTKLAVLAACKSSTGFVLNNGVVDGFTRAIFSTNGGGTVTTLISVEESITTELLNNFYKYLADGNNSAEALYLAKLKIKEKHPNPKYWIPYIYTGSNQAFISNKFSYSNVLNGVGIALFLGVLFVLFKINF
ncbi:MAG: CHAT domain-containing protein [Bacteroidia bacterium]|nr:CHAT domain-containing protein [Bacteroidia bacterium]